MQRLEEECVRLWEQQGQRPYGRKEFDNLENQSRKSEGLAGQILGDLAGLASSWMEWTCHNPGWGGGYWFTFRAW